MNLSTGDAQRIRISSAQRAHQDHRWRPRKGIAMELVVARSRHARASAAWIW